MDAYMFKKMFHYVEVLILETFSTNEVLRRKAMLLLGNAPCHTNDDELLTSNFIVLFSLSSGTSLIQPLDQDVLENIKRNYRKKIKSISFYRENSGKRSSPEALKNSDAKNAILSCGMK